MAARGVVWQVLLQRTEKGGVLECRSRARDGTEVEVHWGYMWVRLALGLS